ncbi:hypothetical protein AOLI_G00326770 [Acnodon oligacanthus]
MSADANDSDLEVERIMERPPSSYGSMRSDDHEDEDEELDDRPQPTAHVSLGPPTRPSVIRLTRSDSPETGITALTQAQQSSVHKEGAFISQLGREQQMLWGTEDTFEEFGLRELRRRAESQMTMEVTPTEPQQPPQNIHPPPEGVGLQSGVVHFTLTLSFVFKAMQQSLSKLNPAELVWFKRSLCSQYKNKFELSQLEECDVLDVVDRLLERRGKGEALHLTIRTLQDINKRPIADELDTLCKRAVVQYHLRNNHTRRYYNLYEGTCRPGQQRFVSDVYAEPPMFIGGDWDINTEHEVHRPNFPSNQGTPIRANDIFRPVEGDTRDEYFTKRTKDPALGVRVLEHIKRSPALYNICQLPLLCWIVAFIYERRFHSPDYTEHLPAITTFYTQYVIVQTNRKIERYVGTGLEASRWKDKDKDFLTNMGKLAIKMVLEERDIFYENEVSDLGLDLDDVTNRGGISTEVRRPGGSQGERGLSFVHYSMQEFMAAMYTYVTFRVKGKNVFEQQIKSKMAKLMKDRPIGDLYKLAVDRALASRNGHLDMFLRFLFGFVTPGTEAHLRGYLLPQYHPPPKGVDDVVKYVNKKIKENASPERCRNLGWCLNELEEGKNQR